MRDFQNITVALVPVGVGKTAMSPLEAADAVNIIEPQIVVPMHYDLSGNGVQEFTENVKESIRVVTFLDTRIIKQKE
jgi:L-ascorbate metabolism protein UlaG (beta-lactamase superfamily)